MPVALSLANVERTRLITSMNNSCASTDVQSHNLLKLTNQIQAGLNWTNRKFVVVEGIREREGIREDTVIIVNNFGSCSITEIDTNEEWRGRTVL